MAYFFPVYDVFVFPYPWGAYGASVLTIVFAVSIARNDLMSPALIVKKGLLYSVMLGFFTALYVLSFIQMRQWLEQYYESKTSVIGSAYIIIVMALICEPGRYFIQRLIEGRLFKGSIQEVHEQKEHLESELERTHRLKSVGILAAGMAHEIRNPIQSLRTFGEHLEKNYNDPEFRSKFEKLLIQETDRIKNLTSDLLDFSKPKEPKKVKTNLNKLINQTLSLLESDLIGDMIQIKRNLPEDPIYKEIDPEQIKQALLNLILNAKDAMKHSKEKTLTVSLTQDKDTTTISIKDTGCGIPEDKIPHLFDPFYTDKKEGTGLGLAITHSIIQRHGGRIEVTSGTTGTSIKINLNNRH